MESFVERPQAQLTRDVKMTLTRERTDAMRSCDFLLVGFGTCSCVWVGWAYDQEGEGQFVAVGVEMVDKHGQDDGDHGR
jgi:hypothetical protein